MPVLPCCPFLKDTLYYRYFQFWAVSFVLLSLSWHNNSPLVVVSKFLLFRVSTLRGLYHIEIAGFPLRFNAFGIFSANCKCKLDMCTVEHSESEALVRMEARGFLSDLVPPASGAAETEMGKWCNQCPVVCCSQAVSSIPSFSCSQDILSRESLNGHALRNEGSKQPVVTFVLGTFPRGVGMPK